MISETSTLRRLDMELEERAELLSEAARKVPHVGPAEREHLRTRALGFLRDELGAHMLSDQRVLYPKIAERLGDPLAAAPLNYADRAIRWWTNEIADADIDDTDELQRLLYGAHALIKVHLSREEDLYVDVVDAAPRNGHGDD